MRRMFALFHVLLAFIAIGCADTESEPRVIALDRLVAFVGDRGPVEFLAVGEDTTTYARGDNLKDAIAAHGGMRRLLHDTEEWSHYVVALPADEADRVKADLITWMLSDADSATTDDANLPAPVASAETTLQPRIKVATKTRGKSRLQRLRRLRGNVTPRFALGVSMSRALGDVPLDFDVLLCTDQSLFEYELEYHCLFILRRNNT